MRRSRATRWIGDLQAGDAGAADRLWRRYFDGLVWLARKNLDAARRAEAVEDEEDAALSAFQSLCVSVAEGQFDRLRDRDDLWRLLVVIAVRKVYDQLKRQRRLKRGAGRVVLDAVLAGPDPCGADGFEQFIAEEPGPEFVAMLAEEFQRRLDGLPNEVLRRVALWRMEGYSEVDIAERLGCVSRSVRRKLELIRKTWLRDKL
jgi:DNA-directed RNA polymerase specialized sigma24 family protein